MHNPRNPWLVRQTTRITSGTHGPEGGTVISTVARQDLLTPGVEASHLQGVLNCIRPAQGEESLGQITW